MIFPLRAAERLQRIAKLRREDPNLMNAKAAAAFEELDATMDGLRPIRNSVAHAVMIDGQVHNRPKQTSLSKDQVFASEELTLYAAHAVCTLRQELGDKDDGVDYALPIRPEIPDSLRDWFEKLAKLAARPVAQVEPGGTA